MEVASGNCHGREMNEKGRETAQRRNWFERDEDGRVNHFGTTFDE